MGGCLHFVGKEQEVEVHQLTHHSEVVGRCCHLVQKEVEGYSLTPHLQVKEEGVGEYPQGKEVEGYLLSPHLPVKEEGVEGYPQGEEVEG